MAPRVAGLPSVGGNLGARAVGEVCASADDVFAAMIQYEQQPKFFKSVRACMVLERQGNVCTIRQTLGWRFLAYRGSFTVDTEVTEDAGARVLQGRLVRGAFLRQFDMRTTIVHETVDHCHVEVEMYFKPSTFVPPLVRHLLQQFVNKQARNVVVKLQEHAACGTIHFPSKTSASSDKVTLHITASAEL